MTDTTRQIIGLEKEIDDPGTGAKAGFHVMRAFSVMLIGEGSSSVTYASYFSRAAFDAGKNPLAHITLQLNSVPAGDIAQFPNWFAERLLAAEQPHDLTGATPVYAQVDGMAEQSVGPGDEEPAA